MLESRLINSVLPPVIVLFSTWLSLCHMLIFNALLTVHTTFRFFYVYFFYVCVFVFYVLFAVCVSGPLWTDFQINEMDRPTELGDYARGKKKKTTAKHESAPQAVAYLGGMVRYPPLARP